MNDNVECPYCGYDNDMSDGTTDLPSDNKFDHECDNCGMEFEVEVEFDPSYSASKIVYVNCEKCGEETRDPASKGSIFPWPQFIDQSILCRSCFRKAHQEEYANRNNEEAQA
jgi:transcription elongation factor Elf1